MWMGTPTSHPRATASPTSPPPAPSSTLHSALVVKSQEDEGCRNHTAYHLRDWKPFGGRGNTDTDLPDMSFECCDRRYLARTIPAGHSCPPQPFFRSSFNNKGSWRKPSKVVVVVPAVLISRGGANESLTLNGASGSDSGVSDLSMSPIVPRKEGIVV
jgi:hypothetical protein